MLLMSMRLSGVSRWQIINGLRSLRVTAAARVKRFEPEPVAIAPIEVDEQGRMIMPLWRNEPVAGRAPTSLLGWMMSRCWYWFAC